jgi:type II secretory pathway pseudopilin PulG
MATFAICQKQEIPGGDGLVTAPSAARSKTTRALTLIELLVVFLIAAVLGAMTLTGYRLVHESSSASKDVNNLRQLALGINAYCTDYGFLPNEAWPTTLNPRYIPNWTSFQSPFDKRPGSEDPRAAPVSYDVNANLQGLRPTQIVSPTRCIFMAPLLSNPDHLQFTSTGWNPSLPAPLSIESNGVGATGGTHQNRTQISVILYDMHAASMDMATFHSRIQNPESDAEVTDLRWNERCAR